MTALCIAIFAFAHLLRDGTPAIQIPHGTQYARAGGLLLCAGGGYLVGGWMGALLGASVGVGFWTDAKHGEGQRARGWVDVPYLIVSGVTSLLPLGLAAILISPYYGLVVLAGLAKPVVWFGCWRLMPYEIADTPFFYPTRWAATIWGALVGGLVSRLL